MIDELTAHIKALEETATSLEATQLLMTIPGLSCSSPLLTNAQIGEFERFDEAKEVLRYVGLDPVVRKSLTRGLTEESQIAEVVTYAGF